MNVAVWQTRSFSSMVRLEMKQWCVWVRRRLMFDRHFVWPNVTVSCFYKAKKKRYFSFFSKLGQSPVRSPFLYPDIIFWNTWLLELFQRIRILISRAFRYHAHGSEEQKYFFSLGCENKTVLSSDVIDTYCGVDESVWPQYSSVCEELCL